MVQILNERIKAIEPILDKYQQSSCRQRYVPPKLLDYTGRFTRRYERVPGVRTMAGPYSGSRAEAEWQCEKPRRNYRVNRYLSLTAGYRASTAAKNKEKTDDWARFFYQPVVIYSNHRRIPETEESQKVPYDLVELNNSANHREFVICEAATSRRVKWDDLPDVNTVRDYLKTHGFPEDDYYSEKQFLQEVENGRGAISLCVERRETAESILNLVCYALIQRSASYSNNCKGVNEKMDENIQEKLTSYLELLGEIKEKTEDERTAAIVLQELSKDRRMEAMRGERDAKNGVPATDKQKKFMTKLGISYPATVTKQEASQLIDEELGRNGG